MWTILESTVIEKRYYTDVILVIVLSHIIIILKLSEYNFKIKMFIIYNWNITW